MRHGHHRDALVRELLLRLLGRCHVTLAEPQRDPPMVLTVKPQLLETRLRLRPRLDCLDHRVGVAVARGFPCGTGPFRGRRAGSLSVVLTCRMTRHPGARAPCRRIATQP